LLFLTPISPRRQVFMPFLEMVLDNQAVDMDAVKEQVTPPARRLDGTFVHDPVLHSAGNKAMRVRSGVQAQYYSSRAQILSGASSGC
jgi:hypothetical protein